MGQTIAIAMQKGGVGKTTTAINLATGLAFHDESVLLVDLDPQGNTTSGLGITIEPDESTVANLLTGDADFRDVVQKTGIRHLSLLPSSMDLNNIKAKMLQDQSNYDELGSVLEPHKESFDWIIIDCPPSLGPLTLNALTEADSLIIPLQCEYYALEGLSQLWETFQRIRRELNPSLSLAGIVLTMFDGRTNLAEEVENEVKEYFGDEVYESIIPRNVRVSEAPGYGQPVMTYAPDSAGTKAYKSLTEEVLENEQ